MISDTQSEAKVGSVISKSKRIAVCLPLQLKFPIIEVLGAGLALALTREEKDVFLSGGKQLNLNLPHKSELKHNQGNRDLVITLPYKGEEIEKVYTAVNDEGKMEVIVQPRKGMKSTSREDIQLSYQGLDVDLILLVGVATLDALGKIYLQNQQLFQEVPLVHFHYPGVIPLGKYNVELKQGEEVEEVVRWLKEENIPIASPGADVFIWGLRYQKNNFQSPLELETVHILEWLLENGGKDRSVITSFSSTPSKDVLTSRLFGLNSRSGVKLMN